MIRVDTGMVWGLKRSLLGYLRRIPDGAVSIDDGVSLTSDYDFHFPLVETEGLDGDSRTGVIRFRGFVHLYGHLGTMNVTLANPWLHLDADAASLSFDTDQANTRETLFDVPTVAPTLTEDTIRWTSLQPLITAAGVKLFQENYAVGTPFDPVSVRVPLRA